MAIFAYLRFPGWQSVVAGAVVALPVTVFLGWLEYLKAKRGGGQSVASTSTPIPNTRT